MKSGYHKYINKLSYLVQVFQGFIRVHIIQKTVQKTIKDIGLNTNLGRYYLPIGSAITVPTMFFPGNIKNTNNIKYCFMAIMFIANYNFNNIIAVPGLGTCVHIHSVIIIHSITMYNFF